MNDLYKSPWSDGFSKEFYETFGAKQAELSLNSIERAKLKNELSSFQRQALIRLIKKINAS